MILRRSSVDPGEIPTALQTTWLTIDACALRSICVIVL